VVELIEVGNINTNHLALAVKGESILDQGKVEKVVENLQVQTRSSLQVFAEKALKRLYNYEPFSECESIDLVVLDKVPNRYQHSQLDLLAGQFTVLIFATDVDQRLQISVVVAVVGEKYVHVFDPGGEIGDNGKLNKGMQLGVKGYVVVLSGLCSTVEECDENMGFEPLTWAVLPPLKLPPEPPPQSLGMELHSIQSHRSTTLRKKLQLMKEPKLDLEDKG